MFYGRFRLVQIGFMLRGNGMALSRYTGADIRVLRLLSAKCVTMSDKPTWGVGAAPGPLLACPAGADVLFLENAC